MGPDETQTSHVCDNDAPLTTEVVLHANLELDDKDVHVSRC
jgi:hypothetical protein